MKSLTTQFIRAVHSAFMRVLCAIPASFLNLKGGGGGRNSPHRNSVRLGRRFRRLFRPAVCGGRGECANRLRTCFYGGDLNI